MKKLVLITLFLGLIISCKENQIQELKSNNKYESFARFFKDIDSKLDKNKGEFWNHSLKGPILLVDHKTREVIANQNNALKEFKKINNVYVFTLPKEVNIANTALDWEGKRWTMVLLPLPKEKKARENLIIHELFHRIQPQIGFGKIYEKTNAHLDNFAGRLFLKLEIEALLQAVSSTGKDRDLHLTHALSFRKKRQSSEEIKKAENSLELNEGIAEYTGMMLTGRSIEELKLHFRNKVENFYRNKTFVRSFAYQTIPMYGYLLSEIKENWHQEITIDTNLTDYIESAFNLNGTVSLDLVAKENRYHFNEIQKEEQQREKDRLIVLANYKEKFINKPTLKLTFENMKISFDPRNIMPIEDFGTVYPTLRVTDNWGILTAENGALLSGNWKSVKVSEPEEIMGDVVKGDGWKLELNKNWIVEKNDNIYKLKKK